MTQLQVVSLFSGVGGIDLGLHAAGATTVLLCEYDKHAQKVLARRFPGTPIHPDVTELTADDLHRAGAEPDRTVLVAGFPCQDLSVAGARRGMGEGTRSGLYWHVDRLMGEFRPAWVVLENVPGLLSATCPCRGDESCVRAGLAVRCPGELHSVAGGGACIGGCIETHGGVMGAVLGSLAQRGYGFAYRVLDAQRFGVPQRRRRVVIVGRLGDSGAAAARVLLEPDCGQRDPAQGQPSWQEPATEVGYGVGVVGEPGGVANTLTARDAKGPLPDQSLGTVIVDDLATATPTLTAMHGEQAGQDLLAHATAGALPMHEIAPNPVGALTSNGVGACGADDNQAQAGHLLPVDARTVEIIVQPLAIRGRDGGAQLEVAPEGSPRNALRAGGGGSSRGQLIAVTTLGNRTHTLTAEGHDASEDGTGRGVPIIAFQPNAAGDTALSIGVTAPTLGTKQIAGIQSETTVRRLTPLECERLQGFPDGWTEGQADTHRYKQMGNAVAVPVFAWVAHRLADVDKELRG